MNEMSNPKPHTYRRFKDGETIWDRGDLRTQIFQGERSHKCPTYLRRTPPCQGACPSGHDIRGWLAIARGMDKPPVAGMPWQEYAFSRMVGANPFPAMMGRVCPAPCQGSCNRKDVDDFVGINSLEQYVGDWAIEHKLKLPSAGAPTGKSVAVVGGGPAGLAAAYFLRRKGHAVTIYEAREKLGGMTRYGIPGYRTPREVLDAEIQRVLDLGVTVVANTKVGVDVPLAELEKKFSAVYIALGAQNGTPLKVPGAEAPNCISGIAFLNAFNDGRLRDVASRVLVIGGGDTAMDVAAVARRLGHIESTQPQDDPNAPVLMRTERDVSTVARRQGAEVTIVYRRPVDKMPAAREEIEHILQEGVTIRPSLVPVEVKRGKDGRANALRVVEVDWVNGKMQLRAGTEFDIECDLIVCAVGQAGDFTGMAELDNGRGLMTVDGLFRWAGRPGIFAGGDVLKPFLLTAAVGNARVAAQTIDQYIKGESLDKRPKNDVFHFDLATELAQRGLGTSAYHHRQETGTDGASFAIHNYEDRSANLTVPSSELFTGYFQATSRNVRAERAITPDGVLGDFSERIAGLTEDQAVAEAKRCMSCGLCIECDNCVIYCPKGAVERYPKSQRAVGHYVFTDYAKCVGCHICRDVCPTGYIQMGLGE